MALLANCHREKGKPAFTLSDFYRPPDRPEDQEPISEEQETEAQEAIKTMFRSLLPTN